MASINAAYLHPYADITLALDILPKGPSLDWTENNQLHDCFKAWRERVEILMTGMALKKKPKEFIRHCLKVWSGQTGYAHIEAVGLTGDDATSIKCILDTPKGHCKPRSNEVVAATAYKQLVHGDLYLPECIENCKEVTAACN